MTTPSVQTFAAKTFRLPAAARFISLDKWDERFSRRELLRLVQRVMRPVCADASSDFL